MLSENVASKSHSKTKYLKRQKSSPVFIKSSTKQHDPPLPWTGSNGAWPLTT